MSKARSPQATRDLGELVGEVEGLGIVAVSSGRRISPADVTEGLDRQVASIFMGIYGSGGPPDSVRAVASGPYLPPPSPLAVDMEHPSSTVGVLTVP